MLQKYQGKVLEKPKQIDAKFGRCSMLKLKLLSTKKDIVIFSKEDDANVLKRYKGEVVECYQDNKGKWKLLTTVINNSAPYKQGEVKYDQHKRVIEINNSLEKRDIGLNRPSHDSGFEGNYYTYNNPPSNNVNQDNNEIESLDLPEPLSDADKLRLNKLIRERARLLTRTIEVMREELNAKGLEFHEGSLRSLSVSLFIHISKHID